MALQRAGASHGPVGQIEDPCRLKGIGATANTRSTVTKLMITIALPLQADKEMK